ncbi:hypothetical protein [Mesorhizobium sp. Cs1299R1N3]|uniref:hypothetical protein n=1 Tax=Mesorhizobium sp. Cs1299R1N3 TaxID=3015173 RepID=UPI00301CD04B
MTLSIAWVRQCGNAHELIFASDSRLSGGGNVDHCQKVFSLPREDCCIAFAGHTTIAYPFILQLQNAIIDYKKAFDREVDITKLKTRVLSLLNFFVRVHEGTIPAEFEKDLLETSFIFGGWSWIKSRFFIWKIFYNKAIKRYVASGTGAWRGFGIPRTSEAPIRFVGDYITEFQAALRDKMGAEINIAKESGGRIKLNYEPLTILAEMLSDPKFTDRKKELRGKIGGAPQVTKIYPFLRAVNFAVEWNEGPKFVYSIKGRVIADFEIFAVPGLDPFTGAIRQPVRGREGDESPSSSGNLSSMLCP